MDRSALIPAPPEAVWKIVSDPHHLPRWWPKVTRVEDVRPEGFTQVIPTKRGRPVRLDYVLTASESPQAVSWAQTLPGTPFERLLLSWTITVTLKQDPAGTQVTIVEDQRLRGSFRLGRVLQMRPARKRVAQALKNLTALLA